MLKVWFIIFSQYYLKIFGILLYSYLSFPSHFLDTAEFLNIPKSLALLLKPHTFIICFVQI